MTIKKRHARFTSQERIEVQEKLGGSKVNAFFRPALETERRPPPKDVYQAKPEEEAIADLQQLGEQSKCSCIIS